MYPQTGLKLWLSNLKSTLYNIARSICSSSRHWWPFTWKICPTTVMLGMVKIIVTKVISEFKIVRKLIFFQKLSRGVQILRTLHPHDHRTWTPCCVLYVPFLLHCYAGVREILVLPSNSSKVCATCQTIHRSTHVSSFIYTVPTTTK